MREIIFIKKYKEKWEEVALILAQKKPLSPKAWAAYYQQILTDLSYAQTHYPESNTTLYLNGLAGQIYRKIYTTPRVQRNKLWSFFVEEVPKVAYLRRKLIYFSFALFFFGAVLGALSVAHKPDFARLILSDYYIDQTLTNIENGDPMAIYKSGEATASSFVITIHNIGVALRVFFMGISAGVLSFFISMQNAFMVGAFQWFFVEKGLFLESFRAIWLHGAVEIFSIIIASSAGFTLASGLLLPSTYTRLEAFKRAFSQGFTLMMGIVPFFLFAGLVEGFVTRYYLDMPLPLNLIIIFGSLAFISYYFLIFPIRQRKKGSFSAS